MVVSSLSQLMAIGDKRATFEKLASARRRLEALEAQDPERDPTEERATGIAGALEDRGGRRRGRGSHHPAEADQLVARGVVLLVAACWRPISKPYERDVLAWNEARRTVPVEVSKQRAWACTTGR